VAKELSRGMRQKVAIGCAYLHNPRVLLFDESLTGLDPRGIRWVKDSITERVRGGVAILISSHLLALVEDVCDHLLIMTEGKSVYRGAVADARVVFAQSGRDPSLEEIFFRATGDNRSLRPTAEK
jgi:ABC-2 type transport system ATP-binding protein